MGVDVSAALQELFQLQEKDLELDRLRAEIEKLPPELAELRNTWEQKIDQLTELKERLKAVRRDYEKNDLELKDLSQKKSKAQAEQLQAESAREATQYENRIQQLSTRIDELTELTLPLIEEMERLEAAIQALEEELAGLKPELDRLEEENRARVEGLEAQYQALAEERARMAAAIPGAVLREYEAIRRARRGVGVTRMVKVKETFRCEACSVQLPTHVAQKVYQGQRLIRCPSCGRILARPS